MSLFKSVCKLTNLLFVSQLASLNDIFNDVNTVTSSKFLFYFFIPVCQSIGSVDGNLMLSTVQFVSLTKTGQSLWLERREERGERRGIKQYTMYTPRLQTVHSVTVVEGLSIKHCRYESRMTGQINRLCSQASKNPLFRLDNLYDLIT